MQVDGFNMNDGCRVLCMKEVHNGVYYEVSYMLGAEEEASQLTIDKLKYALELKK